MRFMDLLRRNPREIGFGLVQSFASSPGQTFFISLFIPGIMEGLGLGAGDIATLYMVATLAAGMMMPVVGRAADNYDLVACSAVTILALAGGCLLLAAATGPLMLVPALFAMRLAGQGMMGHIAMTGIARFFTTTRGRALALVSMGYPAGEALLPIATVLLIEAAGWRTAYMIVAAVLVLAVLPVATLLLSGSGMRRLSVERAEPGVEAPAAGGGRYLVLTLPLFVATPMVLTAVIFHQSLIAADLGLSLDLFAASFLAFAVAQVGASLATGPLVDRLSARALWPFHVLPAALGALLLYVGQSGWLVPVYLGLAGLSAGSASVLRTAIVAEFIPVASIGKVRGQLTAVMVVATAAGPALYGWMMEAGLTARDLLAVSAAIMAVPAIHGLLVTRSPSSRRT